MIGEILSQDEVENLLNLMKSGSREPSVPPTPEMSDLNTIESLIATKKQNESAIVGLADSLQARLNLLNEAVKAAKPPNCEQCPYKAAAKDENKEDEEDDEDRDDIVNKFAKDLQDAAGGCLLFTILIILFLVVFVVVQYTNTWQHQKQESTTITVQPVTEALEEFAARESQVLTADERKKLIAATEIVLNGQYGMPHEIREAFRYERLKAGIDSPAFKTFSEKWAARIEAMQIGDDTESMRSVYESLLRGFKVQAYSDVSKSFSGESVEGFYDVSPSNVTTSTADGDVPVSPGFEEMTDSRRQQRVFRRR